MKLIKNIESYYELICILIGFTLLIGFDVLVAKNTLPLTEGWWEVIAKSSRGKELYNDIYIGLPPLYINFITLLQNFTENLYTLRIIFVYIHVIEICTLAYFFSRFFNLSISILSALISELLISTYSNTYLVKDYHLFLQLLINLYLISFFYFYKSRNLFSIFLLSLFTSGIILTKQNYGAILFLANYLVFITLNDNLKIKLISVIKLTLCVVFLLLIYSSINGFGWIITYIGNDSKGSFITILTRFINEKSTIQLIIALLFFYVIYYLYEKKLINFLDFQSNHKIKINLYKTIRIIAIIFLTYLGVRIAGNKDFNLAIAFVYFYIIIGLLYYWGVSKWQLHFNNFGIISIPILAILYCNTLTAGYNFSGFQVGVTVLFCVILSEINNISKNLRNTISIFLFSVILINFYNNKYNGNSYNWWGYQLEAIEQAKYQFKNKYIGGFNLTQDTYAVLNKIKQINGQNKSTFYTYPNIPLLYLIYDKDLKTKFPVTWFDVIPNNYKDELISEFDRISPDYILWLKPTKSTYDGHFRLKRSESVMSEFDYHIKGLIENQTYTLLWSRPMGIKDSLSRDINAPLISSLECKACSDIEFSKLILRNEIINIKVVNSAKHIYEIEFPNGASYINFVNIYNPTILNSKYPIFFIYKKVNQELPKKDKSNE